MLRYLALALPTAVLVLALAAFGAETLGWAPDLEPLAALGLARTAPRPLALRALALLFEGLALVAFFLLVEGRSGSRVVDGLVAGLAAWLFRGPLLVLAVAELSRLPTAPFWELARLSLVALPVAGVAVALVGRRPPSSA
jgi:hypothetical protein